MMKVVDMHCDTILKLYDDLHHGKEDSLLENDGHIDLKKMEIIYFKTLRCLSI